VYNYGIMARSSENKTVQESYDGLRRWNRWAALLHAFQGVAILVLSKRAEVMVTTNYLTPDTVQSTLAGHTVLASATHNLFAVNIGYVVALFFFITATAHLIIGTAYRGRYEADLKKGVNRARWIEYAVSAGVMMIAVGLLAGVYDFSTLLALFALTAVTNVLGLVMELTNQGKKRANWLPYWLGAAAGIVPWIIVGYYLLGAGLWGSGHIPAFVYWIYGTMFVSSASFAAVLWMRFRGKGKWANYVYAERTFIILSLIAKAALAWQVFAGTLRP